MRRKGMGRGEREENKIFKRHDILFNTKAIVLKLWRTMPQRITIFKRSLVLRKDSSIKRLLGSLILLNSLLLLL